MVVLAAVELKTKQAELEYLVKVITAVLEFLLLTQIQALAVAVAVLVQ
jgi:hypothetical protein